MNARRDGLGIIAALIIGFTAGWWCRRPTSKVAVATQPFSSTVTAIAPSIKKYEPSADKRQTPIITATPSHSDTPSLTDRLAMIRWLKSNRMQLYLPLLQDDGFSTEFIKLYGLTPAETAELNLAVQLATRRLEALKAQYAQIDPASTTEKTIVTIAAFPVEGGKVYDALHAKLVAILGTERYAVFNDQTGDQLGNSFNGFGVARNRYEITLEPAPDGKHRYKVVSSFFNDVIDYGTSGSGTTWGSSNSTGLDDANVMKSFPVLEPFPLPRSPDKTTK